MQVAKTKENLERCKCMDCPSYTMGCKIKNFPGNVVKLMEDFEKVDHYEGMYCAFDKSHCISEDKGCLCDGCPVHAEYKLKREEYCLADGGKH